MRLTAWRSQDVSNLVAALGPARAYAALAKAVRKCGLDGLTLRDAYGAASLDLLLVELGWLPGRLHPFARHKLHAALGAKRARGHMCAPYTRVWVGAESGRLAFCFLRALLRRLQRFYRDCRSLCVRSFFGAARLLADGGGVPPARSPSSRIPSSAAAAADAAAREEENEAPNAARVPAPRFSFARVGEKRRRRDAWRELQVSLGPCEA